MDCNVRQHLVLHQLFVYWMHANRRTAVAPIKSKIDLIKTSKCTRCWSYSWWCTMHLVESISLIWISLCNEVIHTLVFFSPTFLWMKLPLDNHHFVVSIISKQIFLIDYTSHDTYHNNSTAI